MHSLNLENSPSRQVDSLQSHRKDFHFSYPNYGDYYLVLYSYPLFTHPSRAERQGPAA